LIVELLNRNTRIDTFLNTTFQTGELLSFEFGLHYLTWPFKIHYMLHC